MRVRIRLLWATMVAAGAIGLTGVTSAVAAAPSVFTCAGTVASPGVVPAGNYRALRLPEGKVCAVGGSGAVNVSSKVSLRAGAALLVTGGSLNLSDGLTVGRGAVFAVPTNSTPVHIREAVTVEKNGVFILGTETPGGPIFARIRGSLTGLEASTVQIHNTQVSGHVAILGGGADNPLIDQLAGAPFPNNFSDLEDNILGPVAEVGYKGIWGGIIRNTIHGPMTFVRNSQPVVDQWDIGSNVVYGFALCAGNNPPPNIGHSPGAPSVVHGRTLGDQAATCAGVPGGVTGPPPPQPANGDDGQTIQD